MDRDFLSSSIRSFITEHDISTVESKRIVNYLAEAISNEAITILTLVEALGIHLTSKDDMVREKGISLLSLVICTLKNVERKQAKIILSFFCDRLSDPTSVSHAIEGIYGLLSQEKQVFEDIDIKRALLSLFRDLSGASLEHTIRFKLFLIYRACLTNYEQAIQSFGQEFVYGFIRTLEDEKDPRNLFLAFQLAEVVGRQLDLGIYAQDMFEVLFCYFPITFTPSADDPYKLTDQDLKEKLSGALLSTPALSSFLIPALNDKLSSSSLNAKKDSLQLISKACKIYNISHLVGFVNGFWPRISNEVFHGDDNLQKDVMTTLKSIVATLSVAGSSSVELPGFLDLIIEECLRNLKEPEQKLATPSGQLLCELGSVSSPANFIILEKVVSKIIELCLAEESLIKKKTYIVILANYVFSTRTLGSGNNENCNAIKKYKLDLFQCFSSCFSASTEFISVQLAGIKGFGEMLMIPGLLTFDESSLAIEMFCKLIRDGGNPLFCDEVLRFSKDLPNSLDATLTKYLLHPLAESLHDFDCSLDTILHTLIQLSSRPFQFEIVIPVLLEYFESLFHSNCDEMRANAISRAIRTCFESQSNVKIISCHHMDWIIRLMKVALGPILQPDVDFPQISNQELSILDIGNTIASIFRKIDTREQNLVLAKFKSIFLDGNLALLQPNITVQGFNPFSDYSDCSQRMYCMLFTSSLNCTTREASVSGISHQQLISLFVKTSFITESATIRQSLIQAIASIINKWDQESVLYEDELISGLKEIFGNKDEDIHKRLVGLQLLQWVSKALVMKGDSRGYELLNYITEFFRDPLFQREICNGFKVLMGGEDTIVYFKDAFSVCKLLYKQRVFDYIIPLLIEGFSNADECSRSFYLIGFAHILESTPKQVLTSNLKRCMNLLLQSLKYDDADVKSSAIEAFRAIFPVASLTLSTHLGSLIPLFLDLTTQKSNSNNMRVRIGSLKCLSELTEIYDYRVLHPFKLRINKELAIALDDPKRVVRKEAVLCRNIWCMFSASD